MADNEKKLILLLRDKNVSLQDKKNFLDTLDRLDFEHTITADDLLYLIDALKNNTSVKTICFYDQIFVDTSFESFMDILKKNSTLERLVFHASCLTDIQVQCLSETLKQNSTLKYLNFSNQNFAGKAFQSIMDMLTNKTTLEGLDLANCKITDIQVQCLSKILQQNSTLKSLDLSMNQISPAGIKHLSDALLTNNMLQILDLKYCPLIGSEGVKHLTQALTHNTSLKTLSLTLYSGYMGNPDIYLGQEGIQHLAKFIKGITNRIVSPSLINIDQFVVLLLTDERDLKILDEAFQFHKQYMCRQAWEHGVALSTAGLPKDTALLINSYLAQDDASFTLQKEFEAGFEGKASIHTSTFTERMQAKFKAFFNSFQNAFAYVCRKLKALFSPFSTRTNKTTPPAKEPEPRGSDFATKTDPMHKRASENPTPDPKVNKNPLNIPDNTQNSEKKSNPFKP